MARDPKNRVNDDSYETEPESDNDRTKKDERIRQAPYLPRIQVWARDSGPYTLRVGNQWFHCDDLLINGDEYRQQVKKSAPVQPSNQSGASPARRRPLNRQQSYQRTRPETSTTPTSRPTGALVRQPSRDKVDRTGGYGSQALPEPRRKHVVKKRRPETENEPPAKSDVNKPAAATSTSLVPYKPPTSDPPSALQQPKQARPVRPGQISRGSSYQIPVRQRAKKGVRFAPLPA